MKQIPLKIYISICDKLCSFHGDRLATDIWTWHCILPDPHSCPYISTKTPFAKKMPALLVTVGL